MVGFLTGDSILLNPRPQAIFNQSRGCFAFYYKYDSFISMGEVVEVGNAGFRDSIELDVPLLAAEIWVPVHSPTIPFQHKSLVYLRGRMILPIASTDADDDVIYTVHVEVIFAHFRRSLASSQWTTLLSWENARPESTTIGMIIRSVAGTDNSLNLLIESKDDVGDVVEKFIIGVVIPRRLYRPQNLVEGSLVIVVGNFTPGRTVNKSSTFQPPAKLESLERYPNKKLKA